MEHFWPRQLWQSGWSGRAGDRLLITTGIVPLGVGARGFPFPVLVVGGSNHYNLDMKENVT